MKARIGKGHIITTFIFVVEVFLIFYSVMKDTSCESNSDKFVISVPSIPSSLHPHKINDESSILIVKQIYDGFIRRDDNGNIELLLAESIEASEDFKSYSIVLKNTFWSNGEILTSYDIVQGWKNSIESQNEDSTFIKQMKCIKGVSEFKKGKVKWSDVGLNTIDSKTLLITLRSPNKKFIELLDNPAFLPVHPMWMTSLSPSNGIFVIEDWVSERHIILKKNPHNNYENAFLSSLEIISTA